MLSGNPYAKSVQFNVGNSVIVRVEPIPLDGNVNMAEDSRLLTLAEQGGVYARIYSWDGPWVSLGRFQDSIRALKNPNLIPWVKRPTGGKAVLHGHDTTVTIAASLRYLDIHPDDARRVSSVYRSIVEPLVGALCAAGIPAILAEQTKFVRNAGHTADCFAHVSPNDVVDPDTGAKVCGCALRLTEHAVLLQTSIPLTRPLIDPLLVFESPSSPCKAGSLDKDHLANELLARLEGTITGEVSIR